MVQTSYMYECYNCGFVSMEEDDFVKTAISPHGHYVTRFNMYCVQCNENATKNKKGDNTRKAEALAYAINTDYFD